MHPGMVSYWHAQRAFPMCGGWQAGGGPAGHSWAGACGPSGEGFEGGGGGGGGDWGDGGGGFGVRRPLRFLAYKLELDQRQVAQLARILDELKTERAQAEVDRRRTVASLADAVMGETFDAVKAGEGGDLRVKSAERLREAVLRALQQIHAVLDGDQRARLAYLIRTGTLVI
jgi:Spy/CpxP family protein refolding chaperone